MVKYLEIDINDLCKSVDYIDGDIVWKSRPRDHFNSDGSFNRWNILYPGNIAGTDTGNGYKSITITIKGKQVKLLIHRVAVALKNKEWPKGEVDHINHDRSDNRIKNLRTASRKENNRNKSAYKNNKSGIVGVYFDKSKNKWRAQGRINGRSLNLGSYDSILDASKARKEYLKKEDHHLNHAVFAK